MKTLKTIIFAFAALLATVACTKEANPKESVPSVPGTIEVSVSALIGDLAPSEGTKATMSPVIRLNWADGDVVLAFDATQKIGELTVTPVEGGSIAKLSGTISTPATGTTKITLVYSNPAEIAPEINAGKITFDLSTQGAEANKLVVYSTLDYEEGLTSITDKIVPFKFATSLMRVTVTGMADADIDHAIVSNVNTVCELTVSADAEPAVAGTTSGTIIRTTGFTRSNDGRAVFNVSVAAEEENTGRKLTIKQGTLIYGSDLMSTAIDAGTSIISVYALTEQTGSMGKINGHDYVYVAGKKWATQNLTISRNTQTSGDALWKPNGSSTVNVPRTTTTGEKIVIGDYFQWGAYPGYCGDATAADQGLLIYESFTNDGSSGSFSFKSDNKFNSKNTAPYGGSPYTRYNDRDKTYRSNLDISDDVARTLWGDTWRMPTSQEFIELCAACFVEWDATNKGLLFYAPKDAADKGLLKLSESSWKQITETATSYETTAKTATVGTYTATDALLFFPAAGGGFNGTLSSAGTYGYYWSGTLGSVNADGAYDLRFDGGSVDPQCSSVRYFGFSVRPLSD
ncbi:MAG: hypothetical protein Q4F39_03130 [Bacteroidia bacterium]|nr:hypothetical protein [Bacteroidia bacterium]